MSARKTTLIDTFMGPGMSSPGDEYAEAAWEAERPAERDKLARKALREDPDCLDAYVLLSFNAKTQAEELALLREAVRVGDRVFAPLLEGDETEWWGFVGTRPYMRALHGLGMVLEALGDVEEAEAVYRRLLALNPNDNQGIRTLLVGLLLEQGNITAASELLDAYADDVHIEMVMARLFIALEERGADALLEMAEEINKRNAFLLERIAGKGRKKADIEFSPYGITMGGEDEAYEYWRQYAILWRNQPEFMGHIAAFVKANSPRRA